MLAIGYVMAFAVCDLDTILMTSPQPLNIFAGSSHCPLIDPNFSVILATHFSHMLQIPLWYSLRCTVLRRRVLFGAFTLLFRILNYFDIYTFMDLDIGIHIIERVAWLPLLDDRWLYTVRFSILAQIIYNTQVTALYTVHRLYAAQLPMILLSKQTTA